MADRRGVEIDYCPKCRGIWLDRGELDKIIERAAERVDAREPDHQREHYPEKYGDDRHRHGPHGRKRKSLLGEIFDFD
jgi:Zn-finger nucleic acid-binding protein